MWAASFCGKGVGLGSSVTAPAIHTAAGARWRLTTTRWCCNPAAGLRESSPSPAAGESLLSLVLAGAAECAAPATRVSLSRSCDVRSSSLPRKSCRAMQKARVFSEAGFSSGERSRPVHELYQKRTAVQTFFCRRRRSSARASWPTSNSEAFGKRHGVAWLHSS